MQEVKRAGKGAAKKFILKREYLSGWDCKAKGKLVSTFIWHTHQINTFSVNCDLLVRWDNFKKCSAAKNQTWRPSMCALKRLQNSTPEPVTQLLRDHSLLHFLLSMAQRREGWPVPEAMGNSIWGGFQTCLTYYFMWFVISPFMSTCQLYANVSTFSFFCNQISIHTNINMSK